MSFNCRRIQEIVQTTAVRRSSWEIGGRKELGDFGEGRTETGRIARRTSEAEGKINSDKGTNLKGLSVTQQIMSARRKDKKRGI